MLRAQRAHDTTIPRNVAARTPQMDIELVEDIRQLESFSPPTTIIDRPFIEFPDFSKLEPPAPNPLPPSVDAQYSFDYFYEHHPPPSLPPNQIDEIIRQCETVHAHCLRYRLCSVEEFYVTIVPFKFRTAFIRFYFEMYDYKIVPPSRYNNARL